MSLCGTILAFEVAMAKASFEILGVGPDASEIEVKRAYFKLIREHSPEKDPEGFKEIREAYEQMMAPQKDEERPPFTMTDPKAVTMKGRLEEFINNRMWKEAIKEAEAALVIWPDCSYFKYLLVKAYRGNMNTTKAVRLAEKICNEEPNNKYFMREYAMSCYARGYFKRAGVAFEEAYKMGIRDFDFLVSRIDNAFGDSAFKDESRRKEILKVIDLYKDDKARAFDVFMLYFRVLTPYMASFTMLPTTYMYKDISSTADFMINNVDELGDDPLSSLMITAILGLVAKNDTGFDTTIFPKLAKLREVYKSSFNNDGEYIGALKVLVLLETNEMHLDKKVNKYFAVLSAGRELEVYDDPDVAEYDRVDIQLCILKIRAKILSELPYIKEKYPMFWNDNKEFMETLLDQEASFKLMTELRKRYSIMADLFEGGSFYKDFPDERKKKVVRYIPVENRTKFSRPAVGRNEPCPCGSGKKFKKCCMGKRIYD